LRRCPRSVTPPFARISTASCTCSTAGWLPSPARIGQLLTGLVLVGVGTRCSIDANLGLSPWDVLHDGLHQVAGVSFGAAVWLTGLSVLALAAAFSIRPRVATAVNVAVVGLTIDAAHASALLEPLTGSDAAIRVCGLIVGIGLVAIGTALYLGAGLGAGPRDGLMLALARTGGTSVGIARAIVEGGALGVGALLGGRIGAGTLIAVVAIGPLLDAATSVVARATCTATGAGRR
jgi:uncharacterized protein